MRPEERAWSRGGLIESTSTARPVPFRLVTARWTPWSVAGGQAEDFHRIGRHGDRLGWSDSGRAARSRPDGPAKESGPGVSEQGAVGWNTTLSMESNGRWARSLASADPSDGVRDLPGGRLERSGPPAVHPIESVAFQPTALLTYAGAGLFRWPIRPGPGGGPETDRPSRSPCRPIR